VCKRIEVENALAIDSTWLPCRVLRRWYHPLRLRCLCAGRGEAIKLALAAKGVDFDVQDVDYAEMKSDLSKWVLWGARADDGGHSVVRLAATTITTPCVGFRRCRFPFAQAPRFVDDDCNIVQSNAILRHLGEPLLNAAAPLHKYMWHMCLRAARCSRSCAVHPCMSVILR
jgi:hypothetical protein